MKPIENPTVLYVIAGYPSSDGHPNATAGGGALTGIGGSELQAKRVAAALRDQVSFGVLTGSSPGLPVRQTVDGVDVHRIRLRSHGTLPAILDAIEIVRQGRKIQGYNMVQGFQLNGVTIGAASIARLRRVPLAIKIANRVDVPSILATEAGTAKLRFLFRSASAIVIPSQACRREVDPWPAASGKVMFVPNGVDTSYFAPATEDSRLGARTQLGLEPDDFVFCWIGRLDPNKGFDILGRIWPSVAKRHAKAKLLIAGQGSQESLAREMVAAAGGSVSWVGALTDVRPIYAAANANVMTSLSEGLSNVLLEASASGLPTICHAAEENLEVGAADGFVLPYDRGSPDSAVKVMERAMNDVELPRLGAQARLRVAAGYSLAATSAGWMSVYNRLLRNRSAPESTDPGQDQ